MCSLPLEDIFEGESPRHILPARTECPSCNALLWAAPGKTSYILTEQPRTSLRCLTLRSLYYNLLHIRTSVLIFSGTCLQYSTLATLIVYVLRLQQYLTLSHTAVVPGALFVVLHCCTYFHRFSCILTSMLINLTYCCCLDYVLYLLFPPLYCLCPCNSNTTLRCLTLLYVLQLIYLYCVRPCSGALHCLPLLYVLSLLYVRTYHCT